MILKEVTRPAIQGERIITIASSFLYVEVGTSVYDVLEELKEPYQQAIALVDNAMKVQGIIIPQDLVELLGKPFGRDLLQRQKVEDISQKVTTFLYDEYITQIREKIKGTIETEVTAHYILVDTHNTFIGHFTAHDILMHALNDHQRELKIATTIQNRLVPPYIAERKGKISITCSSVMAQGVGGDYYYTKEYEKGKWFFCLCDISGKGLSAAIITAVLSGFFYNMDFTLKTTEIVSRLNKIIIDTFKIEKYLTGFFAKFSEDSGELEYCDMGHSFFYVIEGKKIQKISEDADNYPVGLVENPSIDERFLRIAPGTVLLLLSDGIIEQEDRNNKYYPIEGIGEIVGGVLEHGDDPVKAKVKILESFFTFKKDVPQHDDVSLLLFHYR